GAGARPGPAADGAGLPDVRGGQREVLQFGGRRPPPRGPGLRLEFIPDAGDALPVARDRRLLDLPRVQQAAAPSPPWSRRGRRRGGFVMSTPLDRRQFVAGALSAGALAGLGDFAFLRVLPPVAAADAKVRPDLVQLNPDMEPLVRLIEETP